MNNFLYYLPLSIPMAEQEKLDYNLLLELLDYWYKDKQNHRKVPSHLNSKITKRYVDHLSERVDIETNGSKLNSIVYDRLRNDFLQKIDIETNIESIKKTNEYNDTQIKLQEETKNIEKTQLAISDKQNTLIRISVLLASASLILAAIVGGIEVYENIKQVNLIDSQLKSISPLKPTLEVSIDFPSDNNIAIWNIASIRNDEGGKPNFEKQNIRFILSNIGRMRTGPINAYMESNFTHSTNGHVENIVGESSEYLEFNIWYNQCTEDSQTLQFNNGTVREYRFIKPECDYRQNKLQLGWHKFNLTIKCPLCEDKNKIKECSFKLCFFDNVVVSENLCKSEQQEIDSSLKCN